MLSKNHGGNKINGTSSEAIPPLLSEKTSNSIRYFLYLLGIISFVIIFSSVILPLFEQPLTVESPAEAEDGDYIHLSVKITEDLQKHSLIFKDRALLDGQAEFSQGYYQVFEAVPTDNQQDQSLYLIIPDWNTKMISVGDFLFVNIYQVEVYEQDGNKLSNTRANDWYYVMGSSTTG